MPKLQNNIELQDIEEFKHSEAYKKYIVPHRQRLKKANRQYRKEWIKANWINLSTLVIAVVTLIATIVFGILSLLN